VAFFPEANLAHPWAYQLGGLSLPVGEPGAVVINEVLASNASSGSDASGEFDDWLELVNRSDTDATLNGLYISDDPADPLRFALAAVVLGPGERYVIWCDGEEDEGASHAPFKLSANGESITLSDGSSIRDEVAFGPQAPDVSWSRWPDGHGTWRACDPTLETPNACAGQRPGQLWIPLALRRG
jgi:hypothetical protein